MELFQTLIVFNYPYLLLKNVDSHDQCLIECCTVVGSSWIMSTGSSYRKNKKNNFLAILKEF